MQQISHKFKIFILFLLYFYVVLCYFKRFVSLFSKLMFFVNLSLYFVRIFFCVLLNFCCHCLFCIPQALLSLLYGDYHRLVYFERSFFYILLLECFGKLLIPNLLAEVQIISLWVNNVNGVKLIKK